MKNRSLNDTLVYSVPETEQNAVSHDYKMSLEAGSTLRKIREKLSLRYRDVAEASQLLAKRHDNSDFIIGLSRLADIENRGTVPSLFRLYSLTTIYGLDVHEVLRWYGVDMDKLPSDTAALKLEPTRPVYHQHGSTAGSLVPAEFQPMLDLKKTTYISRQIKLWGKVPLAFLQGLNPSGQRYALIGSEDWSMYPLIAPGSFVQIDETKRRVVNDGWVDDYARPIYFIEHRDGFRCGWCTERRGLLIVQPHHASQVPAEVFQMPGDAEVLGQVVAIAMRLDQSRPRRRRSAATPE